MAESMITELCGIWLIALRFVHQLPFNRPPRNKIAKKIVSNNSIKITPWSFFQLLSTLYLSFLVLNKQLSASFDEWEWLNTNKKASWVAVIKFHQSEKFCSNKLHHLQKYTEKLFTFAADYYGTYTYKSEPGQNSHIVLSLPEVLGPLDPCPAQLELRLEHTLLCWHQGLPYLMISETVTATVHHFQEIQNAYDEHQVQTLFK